MKLSQAVITALSTALFSHTVLAQNTPVSAEKTGYQKLSPDLYGSIEVRHSVLRAQNGDVVAKQVPALSIRPTLGLKLFDSAVVSGFTFVYRKNPGSMVVAKAGLFNETYWTIVSGAYGSISPYAYTQLRVDDSSFQFSNIGVTFSAKHTYENDLGTLKFGAYLEPKVQVLSQKTALTDKDFAIVPRNETARGTLAFDENGTATIEQRDPTVVDDAGLAIKVSPARLTKLSTGLNVDVNSQWKPKYVATESDGKLDTSLSGYERRSLTITRWSIGWALTDKVTLTNSVLHYMGGLYEYPIQNALAETNHELDEARWENRLSLNASLF